MGRNTSEIWKDDVNTISHTYNVESQTLTSSNIAGGLVYTYDGRARLVTDVERTLPVTMEAWIKPNPYTGENCQFLIGSDVSGKYGWHALFAP